MRTLRRSDGRAGFSLVMGAAVAAIIAVAAACGLVVAYALSGDKAEPERPLEASAGPEQPPSGDYEFISFGPTTVNLAEGRLTRLMRVNITLQVKKDAASGVNAALEGEGKAIFTDWLVTHLSDKQLRDVTGTTAINRLRREIQDGFNAILAEGADHKIDAILFEEFLVQ